MYPEIVNDICPPPEWNLAKKDIHQMVDELERYYQDFEPAFDRCDQAAHGWVYLRGLLSDLPRKVTERIALRFGVNVRSLQHFIGQSLWSREGMLQRHQARVVETLGHQDGVLLVDKSGMVKQGQHSVGVARQWCGSVGKVANSQVGVYLGYASRKGHSFLDAGLYLPQEWFEETHQVPRQMCGVPKERSYQTKPEIALELLAHALERGELPFQWVAADELYGDSPLSRWNCRFGQMVLRRNTLHDPHLAGTTRSRCPNLEGQRSSSNSHSAAQSTTDTHQVNQLTRQLPAATWGRARIKEGTKGPLVCDFACLRVIEVRDDLPGQELWLILRRNLDDPTEIKYYFTNPAHIDPAELVRMSGMRWPVEIILRAGKVEVGFDHYELRSWIGWHHHMLFVFLAHHFLVRMRIFFKERAPALTVYQVRLLLLSILPMPIFDLTVAIRMVRYYSVEIMPLIFLIAKTAWSGFQPTLRCNTSQVFTFTNKFSKDFHVVTLGYNKTDIIFLYGGQIVIV